MTKGACKAPAFGLWGFESLDSHVAKTTESWIQELIRYHRDAVVRFTGEGIRCENPDGSPAQPISDDPSGIVFETKITLPADPSQYVLSEYLPAQLRSIADLLEKGNPQIGDMGGVYAHDVAMRLGYWRLSRK